MSADPVGAAGSISGSIRQMFIPSDLTSFGYHPFRGPEKDIRRCGWATGDPLMSVYHDREWGVPVRQDRKHFEFLILEAAQAGLSWLIVLRKRQGYRTA